MTLKFLYPALIHWTYLCNSYAIWLDYQQVLELFLCRRPITPHLMALVETFCQTFLWHDAMAYHTQAKTILLLKLILLQLYSTFRPRLYTLGQHYSMIVSTCRVCWEIMQLLMRNSFCRRKTWCKIFVFISKMVEYIKISQKAVTAFLPIETKNGGHFGLHNLLSEIYLNGFILRWITVKQIVSIKANNIVLIIIKISLLFFNLVVILKIAAILDSTILIIFYMYLYVSLCNTNFIHSILNYCLMITIKLKDLFLIWPPSWKWRPSWVFSTWVHS